ncbi:alpha/beta hydrolase [Negativicoccus succinicivorans]|uniref:alpha/beta fold hydrolase n=1 Tax=Negativicoccus succinicivorans TaxID=620903 RepID=UPI0028FDF818|nr:alpha/beta hydrolase [Negativicoccus succinicivorans]MDU2417050.1 alpha/beta hydrolase [Negativicoccus succinicivorans]
MKNGSLYFKTKDGTSLYVEISGQGRPLMLCHGWLCSGRCWQKNRDELNRHFQVITLDLRGHGRSQKTLAGHTIRQYAADIHEIILNFGLQDVILGGWSLGGPTVLSYWDQFGTEGRVTGVLLIDMTPFPYSPERWNSHALKGFNADQWNAQVNQYLNDRDGFTEAFFRKCWHGEPPADAAFALEDMRAAAPWSAVAIYNDYLTNDFSAVLPTISVPTLVMSSNNHVFPAGVTQGQHITTLLPRGDYKEFTDAGHFFFFEQPEKFNQAVISFGK